MLNRLNRMPGRRGGMGFGFRGSAPAWPYVGIGRGGLPRCAYFTGNTSPVGYQRPPYSFAGKSTPAYEATKEQELEYLKNQAQALQESMEQINKRIAQLENDA